MNRMRLSGYPQLILEVPLNEWIDRIQCLDFPAARGTVLDVRANEPLLLGLKAVAEQGL